MSSKDEPDDFTKVELSPKKDTESVPNNPVLTKIPPGFVESGVSGDGLASVSRLGNKRLSQVTAV